MLMSGCKKLQVPRVGGCDIWGPGGTPLNFFRIFTGPGVVFICFYKHKNELPLDFEKKIPKTLRLCKLHSQNSFISRRPIRSHTKKQAEMIH